MKQIRMKIKTKKRKGKKNAFFYIIPAVIIVLVAWGCWVIYSPRDKTNDSQAIFAVARGEGLGDIASNLAKQGFIKSRFLFQFLTIIKGMHNKLLAGNYTLSAAMNMPEILEKISTGDVVREKITIVEGWNLRDIASHFENRGMFQTEEVLEITGLPLSENFSDEFEFLKEKPTDVGLEGYLFPDTYEIRKDERVEDIIRKFLQNLEKKITQGLKDEIARQQKTLFEVLTMASLLEKEVQTYDQKQMVAGILWKRLENWWPLQVDASLTYITGKGSLELSQDDLEIDSRYNTYKYYGLPLGPICNPGLESIKAAVYYKESPYWFYLTTKDGKVVYSKTLKEHAINKGKYLK